MGENAGLVLSKVNGSRVPTQRLQTVVLSAAFAAAVGREIKRLHAVNVVHCDIKGSNMVVNHWGSVGVKVSLLDFGLSACDKDVQAVEVAAVAAAAAAAAEARKGQTSGHKKVGHYAEEWGLMHIVSPALDVYSTAFMLKKCSVKSGPVHAWAQTVVKAWPAANIMDRGPKKLEELISLCDSILNSKWCVWHNPLGQCSCTAEKKEHCLCSIRKRLTIASLQFSEMTNQNKKVFLNDVYIAMTRLLVCEKFILLRCERAKSWHM